MADKPKVKWFGKVLLAAAICCGCVGIGYGMHVLRQNVIAKPPAAAKEASVQLAVPNWLPPDVQRQLLTQAQTAVNGRSVFDDNLARDVFAAVSASPWVSSVKAVTRHHDGRLEVQAEFRRPTAIAECADGGRVVDGEGYVLPLDLERGRSSKLMLIRGIATAAPAAGHRWDTKDLLDALRLLHMLRDKPYIAQITSIDVRNYFGQLKNPAEPLLRLTAQIGQGRVTDIRMERMPSPDGLDYCVSPQRQLEYLDGYYYNNGNKLAGINSFLDTRFDRLLVSLN